MHVMIVDPLREEKRDDLRRAYTHEIYVMERFFLCMLHHLDKSKFPDKFKCMKVKFIEKRPKQTNGYDYGMYVRKYMDAILNGISLHEAEWGSTLTAITFRYRIA